VSDRRTDRQTDRRTTTANTYRASVAGTVKCRLDLDGKVLLVDIPLPFTLKIAENKLSKLSYGPVLISYYIKFTMAAGKHLYECSSRQI